MGMRGTEVTGLYRSVCSGNIIGLLHRYQRILSQVVLSKNASLQEYIDIAKKDIFTNVVAVTTCI